LNIIPVNYSNKIVQFVFASKHNRFPSLPFVVLAV